MPQFLLEYFSEDIPARMQASAARDLDRLARARLAGAELAFEALRTFAGPRRLTLVVDGLPATRPSRTEERKGPRVGAPAAAVAGFLRASGAARENLVERDGVWFVSRTTGGDPVAGLLGDLAAAVAREFPWPKSMLSADGTLRWVRPLRRLLCLFDGEVVPLALDSVVAGDLTEGHRFMGPRRPIRVRDFAEYRDGLERSFVLLEADRRRERILAGAQALCAARGLVLVDDAGLLDEVTGMAEWPVPLMGVIDARFLDLPPEVIRASMRVHQRYFATRRSSDGALAPHFVAVANIEATDDGEAIAAGLARVLAARLADARFFWSEDGRTPLEQHLEALGGVTFHAKLGSMRERVGRIEGLARVIAPRVGADPGAAALAARLAKADLTTAMVGEFPELQGVIGSYYATAEGRAPDVAAAIRDHYRPLGPADAAPRAPTTIAVALADKLDTLTAFFEAGETPTGSRDPFALRRAALGLIRIILEAGVDAPLRPLIAYAGVGSAIAVVGVSESRMERLSYREALAAFADPAGELAAADVLKQMLESVRAEGPEAVLAFWRRMDDAAWIEDILSFILERLKVALRDEGVSAEVCQAAFALGDDDLARLAARARALRGFLATEDGANLLAGFRRAGNILEAEARKGALPEGEPRSPSGAPAEERRLAAAVAEVGRAVGAALDARDFAAALASLASLRAPVDAFFDKVFVNDPDRDIRDNRLRLLAAVRQTMRVVADFSAIGGSGEGV